jgi:hypothetical protein
MGTTRHGRALAHMNANAADYSLSGASAFSRLRQFTSTFFYRRRTLYLWLLLIPPLLWFGTVYL